MVKKSKWWIWVVVALVVAGIVAWLMMSGNNLPQPPALPA